MYCRLIGQYLDAVDGAAATFRYYATVQCSFVNANNIPLNSDNFSRYLLCFFPTGDVVACSVCGGTGRLRE